MIAVVERTRERTRSAVCRWGAVLVSLIPGFSNATEAKINDVIAPYLY